MGLYTDELTNWERALQQDYRAYYAAGDFRRLCQAYCHEGYHVWRNDAGEILAMGICSFLVAGCTEEAGLRWVATHIITQVHQGILGC